MHCLCKSVFCSILLLAVILGLAAPGQSASQGFTYSAQLSPLPLSLEELLISISNTFSLQQSPPDTEGLLRQRMADDLTTFEEALKSQGYFQSVVEAQLDTTTTPAIASFLVIPGPQFRFDQTDVQIDTGAQEIRPILEPFIKSLPGKYYASAQVVGAETAMLATLRQHGYPKPEIGIRSVVADHATKTVHVRFVISPGPKAAFGPTLIDGLEDASAEYVRSHLSWQEGELYSSNDLERTREKLIRTGIFSSVRITPETATVGTSDPTRNETALVPIRIALLEAPQRSIRGGLWYYSDQGPGVSAGWTHRNLYGRGEEIQTDAQYSAYLQNLKTGLTLPGFWDSQTLVVTSKLEHEITDIYDTRSATISGVFRKKWQELELSYGLAYRLDQIESDHTRIFNLVSTPLGIDYSSTDNPLDPSKGIVLGTRVEPFTAIGEQSSSFVSWSVSGRTYVPILPAQKLILALRGSVGMIAGTGRSSVPENLLLYTGGGGSIRGYAYQYAGDLDEDGDPEGGLSSVDFSSELRFRVNDDFGAVLFSDAGRAFPGRTLGSPQNLFWSIGTGIRYYTPIGPIRFDVAVPLDRREEDSLFQVYVSLGQAF